MCRSRIAALLTLALITASCNPGDPGSRTGKGEIINPYVSDLVLASLNELEVVDDALHFYIIGDWGRQGYFHQADLAETMNQAALVIEPEFIISTGDNFYDNGVASVHDPLWHSSFEDIYRGNFLQIPWYVVLGNHDYRGNPEAQISYSNISQRWNMPSRYWFQDVTLEAGSDARFIFLDTSPCEDEYYEEEKYRNVWTQDSTAQLNWLDSVLESSTHDWRIAIGHHPLYTGGKRVNDVPYVRRHLEPHFDKHKVQVYFCGHEHDLQHIVPADHPTHHFVSGAGAEVRPTGSTDGTHFAASQTGFMIASLTADYILVQAVNWKGEILYSTRVER